MGISTQAGRGSRERRCGSPPAALRAGGGGRRRLVAKILREEPDAIFVAGDLYDGTAIDARRAAEPLSDLVAPHGVYFVAGNHEQFGDDSKYLNAIAAAGGRVLRNEKVDVDGLAVVGG